MNGPGKVRTLRQATALLALLGAGNAWGMNYEECTVSDVNIFSSSGGSATVPIPLVEVFPKYPKGVLDCRSRVNFTIGVSAVQSIHPGISVRSYVSYATGHMRYDWREISVPSSHASYVPSYVPNDFMVMIAHKATWDIKEGNYISVPAGTPLFTVSNTRSGWNPIQITYVADKDYDYLAENCTVNNNTPLDIGLGTSPSTKVTADIHTSLPRKTVSIPVRCSQPVNHPASIRITGTLVESGGTTLLTSSNDAVGIGFLADGAPPEAVTASQLKVPAQITAGTGNVNLEAVVVKRGDIQDIGPFNASATLILSSD